MHGGNVELWAPRYGFDAAQVVDFSANINPYGPPAGLRGVLDRAWKEIARYPDPDCLKLREALGGRHGVGAENIVAGNGASELIRWIARLSPQPEAAIFAPAFGEYAAAVRSAGGEIRYVLANEADGFRHAFGREAAIASISSNLIFIGNPNNPTGAAYPGSLLQSWIRQRLEINPRSLVVVDESFLPFIGSESPFSLAAFASATPGVIVLRSLTKIFSIPGLRLGYCIAHPDLAARLAALLPAWRVNLPAQRCGEALLRETQFLNDSVRLLRAQREILERELGKVPQLKVFESAVNFLLLKLLPEELKAGALVDALARQGLLVRPCDDFAGLEKDRFIRIAVRKPEENERLLKNIEAWIAHG